MSPAHPPAFRLDERYPRCAANQPGFRHANAAAVAASRSAQACRSVRCNCTPLCGSPLPGSEGSSPARPTGPSLAGLYRIFSCLEPLSGGTTCTEGGRGCGSQAKP